MTKRKKSISEEVWDLLPEFGAGYFISKDVHRRMPWYQSNQIAAALCDIRRRGGLEVVGLRPRPPGVGGKPYNVYRRTDAGLDRWGGRHEDVKRNPRSKRQETLVSADRHFVGIHPSRLRDLASQLLDIAAELESYSDLSNFSSMELRRALKKKVDGQREVKTPPGDKISKEEL